MDSYPISLFPGDLHECMDMLRTSNAYDPSLSSVPKEVLRDCGPFIRHQVVREYARTQDVDDYLESIQVYATSKIRQTSTAVTVSHRHFRQFCQEQGRPHRIRYTSLEVLRGRTRPIPARENARHHATNEWVDKCVWFKTIGFTFDENGELLTDEVQLRKWFPARLQVSLEDALDGNGQAEPPSKRQRSDVS